ncbi:Scr1 family TA system antitoxin-like transcriptional regulator [Streptomyces sp. NPDC057426]|uniref:Scr1 family TA system antitoxin-like transcriptional regulator n=1 Tax=Streptomyces sp. NPDC057426 TaxID=3346128 RepID=UPI0036B62519
MVIVLHEACLRAEMGGKQVMREQFEHVLAMSERPNVNIQVLPLRAASVAGSFALLTRPKGERGAYTEGFRTGHYTEELAVVMRFQRVFDHLRQNALDARTSLGLLQSMAEQCGK